MAGLLSVIGLAATSPHLAAAPQTPTRSTYLGGRLQDRVQGIVQAPSGHYYVVGNSSSDDLASVFAGAQAGYGQTPRGGMDCFIAKLSPDLRRVEVWSSFGGSGSDRGYGVQIDSKGRVVVVGFTDSTSFPTIDGSKPHGRMDIFVARFDPDLQAPDLLTVLGGSLEDNPRGSFDIDDKDRIYIGGRTASFDFPTTAGVVQPNHGGANDGNWDGFLMMLHENGKLAWSTFLGGRENDSTFSGVRVHSDGSIYTGGFTRSRDFPVTAGALQTQYGGDQPGASVLGDAVVLRLRPGAKGFIFSTFLGGSRNDTLSGNDALELDSMGRVTVMGQTHSDDFPVTSRALQSTHKGGAARTDGFVARLTPDGSKLFASTLIGGSQDEELSGLAVTSGGVVHISGVTMSPDFPVTADRLLDMYAGGVGDVIVARLSPRLDYLIHGSVYGGRGQASGGFGDRGRTAVIGKDNKLLICGDTDSTDFPTTPGLLSSSFRGGKTDGFVVEIDLEAPLSFGQGKLNSINKRTQLSLSGSVSATGPGYSMRVSNGVPGAPGVLFTGPNLVDKPFFNGRLYVGTPIRRSAFVKLDAQGRVQIPLNVPPTQVGATRVYQFWHVDPPNPDATRVGLSNAVKLTYKP